MRFSQIKPIGYLKANAAEVLDRLAEKREPMLITQNGDARAAIQDVVSYEETQGTLALLKILALGSREVEAGKVSPLPMPCAGYGPGRRRLDRLTTGSRVNTFICC